MSTKPRPRRKHVALSTAQHLELAKVKEEARAKIEVARIEAEVAKRKAWLGFWQSIALRLLWFAGALVLLTPLGPIALLSIWPKG